MPVKDEPFAVLTAAQEEWPAEYAHVTITVAGRVIVECDAVDALETIEFLADRPEKDTHWSDCVVTG
jgi:hypothetical protein